jgi:competence protein ComEC
VAVHTKPDHNNKRTEQNEPAFAYRLRNDLEKGMGRLVKDQRDLPVIKALTLGDKRGVDPGLKKAYGKAGAAHILALSGMHLGIIYMIVSSILGIIGYGYKSKIIKLVLTCIIIACYAFITGMSPSVVRAAIMIMLYKISKISGRKTGKWDMIALSAAIITAVEPHQMTEISFQLSFAAISGIAAFYKPISEAMKKMVSDRNIPFFLKKAVLYTWNTISISVSCQITTMPIAFYYFGTEPSRFLITNLTAIPIVTATLYSFASAALTFWIPGLGNISVMILRKLISTLNNMMEFLGS